MNDLAKVAIETILAARSRGMNVADMVIALSPFDVAPTTIREVWEATMGKVRFLIDPTAPRGRVHVGRYADFARPGELLRTPEIDIEALVDDDEEPTPLQ